MIDPFDSDAAKTGRAYSRVASRSARRQERLSPAEIEELVAFSRQSAVVQMERLQALLDGATLAAEQVQDKRIELLEQGPEVTASEIFLDFALTFFLESPLAGKALMGITKMLLLPRVRRHLYIKEDLLKSVALRAGRGGTLGGGRLSIPVDLEARRLAEEMHRLNRVATALSETGGEAGVYPYAAALAKAEKQIAGRQERPAPALIPTDSPGVTILDLAQAYASKQRLCIQTEQIMLELALRTGRASPESVVAACQWDPLAVDGRTVTLAEIKDQTKRWFEVLIWTLLLWDHAKRGRGLTGKLVGTPKAIFNVVGPIAHFDHVPAALQDYWLVRFINPSTGRPFFHDPPRVVRPGHPVQPGPVANLAGYMSNIADAAERDKVALVARGPLVAKEED